jgi:hypothetical protein
MSRSRYEEFWRAMIWNMSSSGQPAPTSYAKIFTSYLHSIDDLQDGNGRFAWSLLLMAISRRIGLRNPFGNTASKSENDAVNETDTIRVLLAQSRNRRFCNTATNRLGWVPHAAEEGDIICIFYGTRFPYVLRPCGNGQYKLVGEAYLHDMMHGEAMKVKDLPEVTFDLC